MCPDDREGTHPLHDRHKAPGHAVSQQSKKRHNPGRVQKRCVELDGGVVRVTALLDTLKAADTLQASAAADRARAVSNGDYTAANLPIRMTANLRFGMTANLVASERLPVSGVH